MWAIREAVEVFHLLFLRALGTRVDKSLFVLKGGCNLRFFFRSIRYSEDLDLDVRKIAVGTLRSQVERLLGSSPFLQSLRAQSLELTATSAPKQTETTQRWKLRLSVGPNGNEVPTKIEFSRRQVEETEALDPVNGELISHYRLYPVMVRHYDAETAFRQKISALANRTSPQARDIFDLSLLLDAGAGRVALPSTAVKLLPKAVERAVGIGYEEFAGQVITYLDPAYQADYGEPRQWDRLRDRVVDALEALTP